MQMCIFFSVSFICLFFVLSLCHVRGVLGRDGVLACVVFDVAFPVCVDIRIMISYAVLLIASSRGGSSVEVCMHWNIQALRDYMERRGFFVALFDRCTSVSFAVGLNWCDTKKLQCSLGRFIGLHNACQASWPRRRGGCSDCHYNRATIYASFKRIKYVSSNRMAPSLCRFCAGIIA